MNALIDPPANRKVHSLGQVMAELAT